MAQWLRDYTPEEYINRRILYFERQIKKLEKFLMLEDGSGMKRMLAQRDITTDDIENRIEEYKNLRADYARAYHTLVDRKYN